MRLRLLRDTFTDTFTLGRLFLDDDDLLGYTCEDKDRYLERGGAKVYGETAIPRGQYRVVLSWSARFGKYLPEVLGVRGFEGIRIHGGNRSTDTLGCPLLGSERTADGVRNCKDINTHLVALMEDAERVREDVWLTVE